MSDHPLKRLLRKVTGRDAEATAIRESLEEVIEESERESPALSAQERVMLGNLLKFGELTLRDIMVQRAEIVAVDEGIGLADLLKLFREAQHSRLPVFRETLDDPTGLIHVKDVLGLLEPEPGGAYCLSPHARIAGLRRPILFAPPSMRALDLLLKMQATHTHLALVIDEYGGTDGLVSIEDIIEKLWAISPTSMTRTRPPSRPTAMVTSPMPAWTWTISGPRPAMICWLRRAKTISGAISTVWAGWWCHCWGACRCAAKSWPIPMAPSSRCWRLTRAVSASCESLCPNPAQRSECADANRGWIQKLAGWRGLLFAFAAGGFRPQALRR